MRKRRLCKRRSRRLRGLREWRLDRLDRRTGLRNFERRKVFIRVITKEVDRLKTRFYLYLMDTRCIMRASR